MAGNKHGFSLVSGAHLVNLFKKKATGHQLSQLVPGLFSLGDHRFIDFSKLSEYLGYMFGGRSCLLNFCVGQQQWLSKNRQVNNERGTHMARCVDVWISFLGLTLVARNSTICRDFFHNIPWICFQIMCLSNVLLKSTTSYSKVFIPKNWCLEYKVWLLANYILSN